MCIFGTDLFGMSSWGVLLFGGVCFGMGRSIDFGRFRAYWVRAAVDVGDGYDV